jgi:hypothetical protein
MKLRWARTVIAGDTKPYDFAASDGEVLVGRIYKHDTHGGPANWFWAMNASGPGIIRSGNCNGTAGTKAEAVRLVEETYQRCRRAAETDRTPSQSNDIDGR